MAAEQCSTAHALSLPEELPPARGNKYALDEGAAEFGLSLFFDSNLGHGFSCASCHAPESAFADRRAVSIGKGTGTRNSPTTFNAARLTVFFWDGRADSLWSQPLMPIENPLEMASTRLELAHFINERYRDAYEGVFGPLLDVSALPETGMPGDEAFDSLDGDTQRDVNRFYSNIGKALEAYMRKGSSGRAPLDAYLDGDHAQLLEPAQRGLGVFLEQGCAKCHGGPMLTDERFHDVGFPSLPGAEPDPGRVEGLKVLRSTTFSLAGEFADRVEGEPPPALPEPGPDDEGSFRTPSLRNVGLTFPYGHDGALRTLGAVLDVHAPELGPEQRDDLLAFFSTLNGQQPPTPWNDWPFPQ